MEELSKQVKPIFQWINTQASFSPTVLMLKLFCRVEFYSEDLH